MSDSAAPPPGIGIPLESIDELKRKFVLTSTLPQKLDELKALEQAKQRQQAKADKLRQSASEGDGEYSRLSEDVNGRPAYSNKQGLAFWFDKDQDRWVMGLQVGVPRSLICSCADPLALSPPDCAPSEWTDRNGNKIDDMRMLRPINEDEGEPTGEEEKNEEGEPESTVTPADTKPPAEPAAASKALPPADAPPETKKPAEEAKPEPSAAPKPTPPADTPPETKKPAEEAKPEPPAAPKPTPPADAPPETKKPTEEAKPEPPAAPKPTPPADAPPETKKPAEEAKPEPPAAPKPTPPADAPPETKKPTEEAKPELPAAPEPTPPADAPPETKKPAEKNKPEASTPPKAPPPPEFEDTDFPAKNVSLGDNLLQRAEKIAAIPPNQWEWSDQPAVATGDADQKFLAQIRPTDVPTDSAQILQASWLTSAMTAMAEFPASVRSKLFQKGADEPLSKEGKYTVRLFNLLKFEFETVVIDDQLPVDLKTNVPLGGKGEVWAHLVLKAAAKMAGTYGALQGPQALFPKGMAMLIGTETDTVLLERYVINHNAAAAAIKNGPRDKKEAGEEGKAEQRWVKQDVYFQNPGAGADAPKTLEEIRSKSRSAKSKGPSSSELFKQLEHYDSKDFPMAASMAAPQTTILPPTAPPSSINLTAVEEGDASPAPAPPAPPSTESKVVIPVKEAGGKEGDTKLKEISLRTILFPDCAYSLVGLIPLKRREDEKYRGGLMLLRGPLRGVWRGPWSLESEEWKAHAGLQEEVEKRVKGWLNDPEWTLKSSQEGDGTLRVSMAEFEQAFDKIDVFPVTLEK
uniref:Calpain catalytic domain-containing protein n=1 Tax=Chromera velia CCMP2878 TaxID=1169474 RepID=A0A0G4FMM6_9ALVE|eukprot:Cvel_17788.t1-p1 / transcript=Cvel_17788.t1 / gene=Cvel_17788 / organism=Chromera_velia_CCMP2878 / gene_product=hypothetical protein / transcript_product=hypothetical protein / location=Cvel_scaffold1439:16433-21113(+) / protein_length=802 / sequence_SO=supercontig / SO=protein_coding / is_pseudo=false